MATYLCGPSVLQLTGHAEPVRPGSTFAHDFTIGGPEGEYGPAREAALIAAGAMMPEPEPPALSVDQALADVPAIGRVSIAAQLKTDDSVAAEPRISDKE